MTKTTFIETSAHKRFVEFAKTVRKDRTIGLFYGPAGGGKTRSARRYAKGDIAELLLESWGPRGPSNEKVYAALERSAKTSTNCGAASWPASTRATRRRKANS